MSRREAPTRVCCRREAARVGASLQAAEEARTRTQVELQAVKRRLRQYAQTLDAVSIRAKEEIGVALSARNLAREQTRQLTEERNTLATNNCELAKSASNARTEAAYSANARAEVESTLRDTLCRRDELVAALRTATVAREKSQRCASESETQRAIAVATLARERLERRALMEDRDMLADALASCQTDLAATKRELALVRHTLATRAPPEISQAVRRDIAEKAALAVEKRTLQLIRDVARHYLSLGAAIADSEEVLQKVGGLDTDDEVSEHESDADLVDRILESPPVKVPFQVEKQVEKERCLPDDLKDLPDANAVLQMHFNFVKALAKDADEAVRESQSKPMDQRLQLSQQDVVVDDVQQGTVAAGAGKPTTNDTKVGDQSEEEDVSMETVTDELVEEAVMPTKAQVLMRQSDAAVGDAAGEGDEQVTRAMALHFAKVDDEEKIPQSEGMSEAPVEDVDISTQQGVSCDVEEIEETQREVGDVSKDESVEAVVHGNIEDLVEADLVPEELIEEMPQVFNVLESDTVPDTTKSAGQTVDDAATEDAVFDISERTPNVADEHSFMEEATVVPIVPIVEDLDEEEPSIEAHLAMNETSDDDLGFINIDPITLDALHSPGAAIASPRGELGPMKEIDEDISPRAHKSVMEEVFSAQFVNVEELVDDDVLAFEQHSAKDKTPGPPKVVTMDDDDVPSQNIRHAAAHNLFTSAASHVGTAPKGPRDFSPSLDKGISTEVPKEQPPQMREDKKRKDEKLEQETEEDMYREDDVDEVLDIAGDNAVPIVEGVEVNTDMANEVEEEEEEIQFSDAEDVDQTIDISGDVANMGNSLEDMHSSDEEFDLDNLQSSSSSSSSDDDDYMRPPPSFMRFRHAFGGHPFMHRRRPFREAWSDSGGSHSDSDEDEEPSSNTQQQQQQEKKETQPQQQPQHNVHSATQRTVPQVVPGVAD